MMLFKSIKWVLAGHAPGASSKSPFQRLVHEPAATGRNNPNLHGSHLFDCLHLFTFNGYYTQIPGPRSRALPFRTFRNFPFSQRLFSPSPSFFIPSQINSPLLLRIINNSPFSFYKYLPNQTPAHQSSYLRVKRERERENIPQFSPFQSIITSLSLNFSNLLMAMKSFALLFLTLVLVFAMASAQGDELLATFAPAPAPALENGSGTVMPGFCALLLASLVSLMGFAIY